MRSLRSSGSVQDLKDLPSAQMQLLSPNGVIDLDPKHSFLDPNGAMDVTNGVVFGHVFGGDSHDFQFVSGATITVPEPSTFFLLGLATALAPPGHSPSSPSGRDSVSTT